MMKAMLEVDPEKKPDVLKNFLEVINPKYLKALSKILEANGGGYLVGSGVTWADVYVCHFIPYFEEFAKIDLTTGFPVIKDLIEKFYADPRVQKWQAVRPEVPHFTAETLLEKIKEKMSKK
jgi:glutathione S-transferase